MRIDIWFDFVCPWCYIGKRRFERALASFEHREKVEAVPRSFLLNRAIPVGQTVSRVDMLMRKYGLTTEQVREMNGRLEQTAAGEGLEFQLSSGVTGSTFDAHRLLHLARERGMHDALTERFYRAYFTEGRSLFDEASLVELSAEAGLDRAAAEDVLRTDAFGDAVERDLAEANAFGASGVPFFVFAQAYRLSGAQPPATFEAALARAWSETHAFAGDR